MSSASTTRADRALATRRRMVSAAYDLFCAQRLSRHHHHRGSQGGRSRGPDHLLHLRDQGRACSTRRWGPRSWVSTAGANRRRPAHRRAAALAPLVGRLRGGPDLRRGLRHLLHPRRRHPRASSAARRRAARCRRGSGGRRRAEDRRATTRRVPTGKRSGSSPRKRAACGPDSRSSAATDILVVLFSAELYQSIRTGRGWSGQRTRTFLRDLLSAQLLEEERRLRP